MLGPRTATAWFVWLVVFVLLLARANTSGAADGSRDDSRRLVEYQHYALTHDGDRERGKALFFDKDRTRCAECHKVGGKGADVGPELTTIGGKFARSHLIESLLEPSRQIVEGYRTSVIWTSDGRVETGIIKQESATGLTIVDVNGARRTIARSDIEGRGETDQSLMPLGQFDQISAAQFTDLIAYLESLRSSGNASPGSHVSGGIRLPEGFEATTIASGLTGCTALETLRDGRILVCEQTGTLRVVKDNRLLDAPALTLTVDSNWERGLIGVTVDPRFPELPFIYVCYVAKVPFPHHRVSRFTMRGDVADVSSETILLKGDDQTKLGGHVPAGHQGGALHFGPDGALYITIGEQTAGKPSQDLHSFLGKMLRIHPDGAIPTDNPFVARTQGKYRAIWALGLRNPFTFAIRPATGTMCINDVGNNFEEINLGVRGGNYGWPVVDGPSRDDRFVGPIYSYPHASVCGGDFAPDDLAWPERFRGKYLFGEFIHGSIRMLDPEHPDRVETVFGGLRNLVDLRFAREGSLYVLLRNAWVIDGKFQPRTGALLQIRRSKS